MMFTHKLVLASACLFIAACAHTPRRVNTAESQPIAPPPFSAQQIRDATPPGRTYKFQIEAPGRPTRYRRITFRSVNQTGCTFEAVTIDQDGVAGEIKTSQSTWDELVGHASYPKHATVIADVVLATPFGLKRCRLYTVTETRDGVETVTHTWFANDMPGAPVRQHVMRAGGLSTRMFLVEYDPGR